MINRLVIGLCAVAGLGVALFVVYQLGASNAYDLGYARGQAAAQNACQQARLDGLTALIDSTTQLTHDAHNASKRLEKTISDRQQADAKATKEIRDALAETASSRTGCVFDDRVMRQLGDARERAAQAAASGLGSQLPATR